MGSARLPAETYSPAEVAALLGVCSPKCPTGCRNRALLAVLYRAGLRIAEALDLAVKDIDLDAGTVRVLHGKGDRSRTSGIDAGACALLRAWIDRRADLGFNGRQPLFCTLKGEPIEQAYIRALLPRLARKAGIDKRVHAHGFRHTHASELRSEGVDVGIISKQLGHASIATTARYLDHINPAEVIDTVRSRRWEP